MADLDLSTQSYQQPAQLVSTRKSSHFARHLPCMSVIEDRPSCKYLRTANLGRSEDEQGNWWKTGPKA
jgi:hypothetical protein